MEHVDVEFNVNLQSYSKEFGYMADHEPQLLGCAFSTMICIFKKLTKFYCITRVVYIGLKERFRIHYRL